MVAVGLLGVFVYGYIFVNGCIFVYGCTLVWMYSRMDVGILAYPRVRPRVRHLVYGRILGPDALSRERRTSM